MAVADDVRGRCGACRQWFPIDSDTVYAMTRAVCPLCSGTADQIEQRTGDLRIAIEVELPAAAAATGTSTVAS